MSSLFKSPKVSSPPPTPKRSATSEISQASVDAQRKAAAAKGRRATILGGGLGEDNVASKSLLGQ